MAIDVDPDALRGLSGQASGLAGEVTGLITAGGDASEAVVGHASLAAAIAEFESSWSGRCQALADEVSQAASFLATVADTFAQTDQALASS